MSLVEIAADVRQYWIEQGLTSAAVIPVVNYPFHLCARLPVEWETFIAITGAPDDNDKKGFLFWGCLRTATEVLEGAQRRSKRPPPTWTAAERSTLDSLWVFADYFQESWWYGLWISGEHEGHVSIVTGIDDPHQPIGTFGDFLRAYLVDDPLLYAT